MADPKRNRFVLFTKNSSIARVLITTPTAVSAAGFNVNYITMSQAQDLFTEANGGLWSDDETGEYYVLPE